MEDTIENKVDAAPQPQAEIPAPKFISIDHFAEIDFRVGIVEEAETLPKSRKLLKLQVNMGEKLGRKQIVSGIAQSYTPESIVGKRIIVVANLQPVTLMGHESQGMLLAVESVDHSRLDIIQAPNSFEAGSKVQ